jgi:trans-aconitate 2-methyltransferase
MLWDPQQYARYGEERSRPFFDLVGQVAAASPASVVDLGCGPGALTATLAQRWPGAHVLGIDSSPEMIARTAEFQTDAVSFSLADAADFSAVGVDVLVSNALLQWVPGHLDLLKRWASELNDGGWMAFQVPANFDSPSHQLMRAVASSPRWRDRLGEVLRHREPVARPDAYVDLLADAGMRVNAWQTEYMHVLPGGDPVLEWVRGTGLRPVLNILSGDELARFEASYATLLRDAYPKRPYGTVFPFRRTFVVASR